MGRPTLCGGGVHYESTSTRPSKPKRIQIFQSIKFKQKKKKAKSLPTISILKLQKWRRRRRRREVWWWNPWDG
ncbi:hypothetical protein GBA52_012586 [Prunus armeniaca]|nr:hypothetical protein GBA52_012586 [Prunus armeniaca]